MNTIVYHSPPQRLKFFRQAWVSLEINRDKNRIKGERRGCWVRARVGRREERKMKGKQCFHLQGFFLATRKY